MPTSYDFIDEKREKLELQMFNSMKLRIASWPAVHVLKFAGAAAVFCLGVTYLLVQLHPRGARAPGCHHAAPLAALEDLAQLSRPCAALDNIYSVKADMLAMFDDVWNGYYTTDTEKPSLKKISLK